MKHNRFRKNKINRLRILTSVLKYLKNTATEKETLFMFDQLQIIFNKGDQSTLNFIINEVENQQPEVFGELRDLIECVSSSIGIIRSGGESMEAVLFLIPVVMLIDTRMHLTDKQYDDEFTIEKLGVIRNLMIETGLISKDEENVSILTRLFSLENILSLTDIEKYELLKSFILQREMLVPHEMTQNKMLPSGTFFIKLKFILGCAVLKSDNEKSLLYEWTHLDTEDENRFKCASNAIQEFSEKISEELPNILNKKTDIEVHTSICSLYEYNMHGIRMGIQAYDDFHWETLLDQTIKLSKPKVKILKPTTETNLTLVLLEGDTEVFKMEVNTIFESPNEFDEYCGELINDLEFYEFYCKSITDEAAIFVRKKVNFKESSRNDENLILLN